MPGSNDAIAGQAGQVAKGAEFAAVAKALNYTFAQDSVLLSPTVSKLSGDYAGLKAGGGAAGTGVQVIQVGDEADLVAAINQVNAVPGNYAIHFTANIQLNGDLPAFDQPMSLVRIDGDGHILDGQGRDRGFVVDGTQADIQDLTIGNASALGGQGGEGKSGGGGGAGLGGGLLAVNNAHVGLKDVAFNSDTAKGGAGGEHVDGDLFGNAGYGGGGGMGGDGGGGTEWHSGVGPIVGHIFDPGTYLAPDDGRNGASGGGGGFGTQATGGTAGSGTGSAILAGAGGGNAHDDGTTSSNDVVGDGGGIGAQGVDGGFGGGGAGGASETTGGTGGYGGGGGGGGDTSGASGGGTGGFGGGGGGGGDDDAYAARGGFGGGAGSSESGGGGAGLGGAIFADATSSISIDGGGFSGNIAVGGAGGSDATNGNAYGNAIFLDGNQVLPITVEKGQTLTLDGGIADETGSGDPNAGQGSASVIATGGGTLVLSQTASFAGGVIVTDGTTVELAAQNAAGSAGIVFAAPNGATVQADASAFQGSQLDTVISDMGAGDKVDLAGFADGSQVVVQTGRGPLVNGQTTDLVMVRNESSVDELEFNGLNSEAQFQVSDDGKGGTLLTMSQSMPEPSGLTETTAADGSLTFSGTAQAGSTVALYQIQHKTGVLLQLGLTATGADGSFSFSPTTAPDGGAGSVAAVAIDADGNMSKFSNAIPLPSKTGGEPPQAVPGMVKPEAGSVVLRVGSAEQLADAINQANAGASPAPLTIQFTNDIDIGDGDALPALQTPGGVTILGNGHTLAGQASDRGLLMFGAKATIADLNIEGFSTVGGDGGAGLYAGGGGAGLGGGLLVAGNSNAVLDDVHFSGNSAVGGKGGKGFPDDGGVGGGGGLGGRGGSAAQDSSATNAGGGGVGGQAAGEDASAQGTQGTGGIPSNGQSGAFSMAPLNILHEASGGAAGASDSDDDAMEGQGGGLLAGQSGYDADAGWGGGGAGASLGRGGNGGFGGGGGGHGGAGGFGGGGGGVLADFGYPRAPGGFGGGEGGDGAEHDAGPVLDPHGATLSEMFAGRHYYDNGGGGGLGAGGAVFVEQGSKVTLIDGGSAQDQVAGGDGQSGGQNGQAYGSGWFLEGNQSVTFAATAGRTTTIKDTISDETGSHDQSGATGAGTVTARGPGTVALEASNTYTGGTQIDGATLELGTAGAAGTGDITFVTGTTGELKLDAAATQAGLTNGIAGFAPGDSVDIVGLDDQSGNVGVQYGGATDASTGKMGGNFVVEGPGQSDGVHLILEGATPDTSLTATSDGKGGTRVTLTPTAATAPEAAQPAAGSISNLGEEDAGTALHAALAQGSRPSAETAASSAKGGAAGAHEPDTHAALVALPGEEHKALTHVAEHTHADAGSHHTH